MRRAVILFYVLALHIALAIAVVFLFRGSAAAPAGSKLTFKAFGADPHRQQAMETLVGQPLPSMGLDMYYDGVHLASVGETGSGLSMVAVSPPGSGAAWYFDRTRSGSWESKVYRAVPGTEGAANIVCASPVDSVVDRDADGVPEELFERIAHNRVLRLKDDAWEVIADRSAQVRFDIELAGSGPDPFAQLFVALSAEPTEGSIEGSWGSLWDYYPREGAAPAEDRALRALGDATGPTTTNRLRGLLTKDGLRIHLHPDAIGQDLELVLQPSEDDFVGSWQYVTDAGVEASGTAKMIRRR